MAVSKVISKIKTIWSGLADKESRDEYVAARLDTDLAFQIYALRKQRGWTQARLATACGNPNGQGAICRLESSAEGVSLSTLRELASAFDVALSVKFLPFSQLVEDSVSEKLDRTVPSYDDDALPTKFAVCMQLSSANRPVPRLALQSTASPWAMVRETTPLLTSGSQLETLLVQ